MRARGPVAGHEHGTIDRARGQPSADRRFPEAAKPVLEPCRQGALQSGREPQGRERPFRLHGDVHDAADDSRAGAASSIGSGTEGVRRGCQQGPAAVAAAAGAEGGRGVRLAKGHGRCGRDLPSTALDARRGPVLAARRAAARARRHHCAHARDMAHGTPRPPPGESLGRRQAAVDAGPRCDARLRLSRVARRRDVDGRRGEAAAGGNRRPRAGARQVGRDRPRASI